MGSDRGVNAWYVRQGPEVRPGRFRTRCYIGDQFPDATLHLTPEFAGDVSGAMLLWESSFDDKGHVCVQVNRDFAPNCPPLWFVSVPGRESEPRPIHNLVAFHTNHITPNTIIDDPEFMFLKLSSEAQVAAIQWGKETGANLMLFGEMTSETDVYNKRRVVNYVTTLFLTDMETNKRVWVGQHEIKKDIRN